MGTCVSRLSSDSPIPIGSHTPLKDLSKMVYSIDESITKQELEQRKRIFWETAPSYGGKYEVWEALKAGCEAIPKSHELALAIFNSAQLILPTGDPSDGCYDTMGNHYQIPKYCFVDPINLVQVENQIIPKTIVTNIANSKIISIILRLNTGREDIRLEIDTEAPFAVLIQKTLTLMGSEGANKHIKLFYMGKPLLIHQKASEVTGLQSKSIIQGMIIDNQS